LSFVRLHYPAAGTGVITTYDIDGIWDVAIDAQAISGASYWVQEGRSATFTMGYDTIWEQFINNANKPKVFRALVEIYESYSLADADGEISKYERKVFTGYLTQGSFEITTHGEWYKAGVYYRGRTIRITAFDYISILIKDPPYDMLTIESGTQINVEAEIRRLWEMKPYSSNTSSTLALWTRPPLTYEVETTPGYGVYLTDYAIWKQSTMPPYPADVYICYARLYEEGDNILIESARFGYEYLGGPVGRYYCSYQRYRIDGSTAILILDDFYGDLNDYSSWQTIAEWETEIGIDLSTWTTQTSVSLPLIRYDLAESEEGENGQDVGYSVNITGRAVIETITTLNTDEPIEVGYLEWLQFLLNLQMAFVHEGFGDNQWAVSNKAFFSIQDYYPFAETAKITAYSETTEDVAETLSTEYAWLQYGTEYTAAINSFMREQNAGRYNKVIRFAANARVPIGRRIMMPRLNPNAIYITAVGYDMNRPQLYEYEGRSL